MSEQSGMINIYTCPHGHRTVTLNLADGVTPFMIRCRAPLAFCEEMANSCFYLCDQNTRPTHVWEKINPSFEEARAMSQRAVGERGKDWADEEWDGIAKQMLEHYAQGGLHLRRANAADLEPFGFKTRRG